MTSPRPQILSRWLDNPPTEVIKIFDADRLESDLPIGEGFEMTLGSLWQDPDNQTWHRWTERWLAVCCYALRERQIKGFSQRLLKAEQALKKLADRPGKDALVLEKKVAEILKRYRVSKCPIGNEGIGVLAIQGLGYQ
jgi:hypothetical protein